VDLWSVERRVTLCNLELEVVCLQRLGQQRLGFIPKRDVAHELLRVPRGQYKTIAHPKRAVDAPQESKQPGHLVEDLILGDEDVRVVLLELSNSCESRKRPGALVAVQRTLLGESQRQFAVASAP